VKDRNNEARSSMPQLLQHFICVDTKLVGAEHAGLPTNVNIPLGDCTFNGPKGIEQHPESIDPILLLNSVNEWCDECFGSYI
jgi:hypothetical protein